MIVLSLCNVCFQTYELHLKKDDAFLLDQIQKEGLCLCPRLCGGRINLTPLQHINEMHLEHRLREPITLNTTELYQAIGGMGLPDEIPKDRSVLEAIIKTNPVVDVDVRDVQGRLYLDKLYLQNGITVYLTSGAWGARVLKITRKENSDAVGRDSRSPGQG